MPQVPSLNFSQAPFLPGTPPAQSDLQQVRLGIYQVGARDDVRAEQFQEREWGTVGEWTWLSAPSGGWLHMRAARGQRSDSQPGQLPARLSPKLAPVVGREG